MCPSNTSTTTTPTATSTTTPDTAKMDQSSSNSHSSTSHSTSHTGRSNSQTTLDVSSSSSSSSSHSAHIDDRATPTTATSVLEVGNTAPEWATPTTPSKTAKAAAAATTTTATTRPLKKAVSFDQVFVHEFAVMLGDNPSVSKGAPLTLNWKALRHDAMELDMYEYLRQPERKPNRRRLILSNNRRMKLLLNAGHSVQEIATVTAQVEEDKKIRAKHALEAVKMMTGSRTDKLLANLNLNSLVDLLSGAAEGTQSVLMAPSTLLVEASKATGQAMGKVVTQTGNLVHGTSKVVTQTGKLATDAVVNSGKLGYDVVKETSKKGRDVVVGGVKGTGKVVVGTGKLGLDVVKGTGKVGLDVVKGTGKVGLDVVKGTGKVGMDVVKGTGKVGRDVVVGSVIGTGKVVVGTGKVATDVVVGTGKLGYEFVTGTGNAVKSTGKRVSNAFLNMSVSNLSSRELGYGDDDESAPKSSSLGNYTHPMQSSTNSHGINPYGSNNNDDDDDESPSKGGFFSRRGSGGGSDIQKIPRRGSVTAAVRNLGQRVVGRSRSGAKSVDPLLGTEKVTERTPPKHSASAQSKLVSMVRGAARSSSSKSTARSSSSSKGPRRSLSAGKEVTRNSFLQETRRASDLEQMQQCLGYGYGDRLEDEDESEKDIYDDILGTQTPIAPKRRPSPTGAIPAGHDDGSVPGNIISASASVASTTSSIDDIDEKQSIQHEQNHESISVDSLMYSSREECDDIENQEEPPQPPPLSSMLGGIVGSSSYSSNDDSFVSALLPPPEEVMGVGDVDPSLYFT